jgi:bifunctional non-homologous end joining protein LigD
MLATLADAPLQSRLLVYEPKYDGIRALAEIRPGRHRSGAAVHLWSRNGNEKTAQFPTIAHALATAGRALKGPLVLDGEIVALDEHGRPAGFQRLQGRMHLLNAKDVDRAEHDQPAAFIAFDVLIDGADDLTRRPLTERRARLEDVMVRLDAGQTRGVIRLSEQVAGDAREMYARAQKEGWEGLIAKDAASSYQPGRRTPAWRKLKLIREEEFVVGGWTEPRQTRQHFGALLLGMYDGDRLVYVGHIGTGFDEKELARVAKLLKARATKTSPFGGPVASNEPSHWVRPDLVAQVKFSEWTSDHKLRHPVYLGLRDDKRAKDVVAPPEFRLKAETTPPKPVAPAHVTSAFRRNLLPDLLDQLTTLEKSKKDGLVTLPDGSTVKVTNLAKIFYPPLLGSAASGSRPADAITKGDLLRYYVEVSPLILPCVADRLLVMKRFPNGIGAQAFYQHKVAERGAQQFVGGSLATLLEMTQLAAISQDPWFSRVESPQDADYAAIDLDPGDGATFATVLDVARWVRDELGRLNVAAFAKTSGSRGLHIYVPLPPHTSYESGMLFCQIVATIVAARHPKQATVERTVKRRAKGTIYVDYLQNIEGKTLATAYSARANEFAGVSTPLAWKEIDGRLDPRDFTVRTAPARFAEVGDLWAGLRTAPPVDLEAVLKKYQKS